MLIRQAQEKDFPELVALYQNCFAEPPWFEVFDTDELLAEFKEILSWPDAIFLVCEHEGKIVGGATGFSITRKPDVLALIEKRYANAFYFADLFVNPAMRKQGIGKSLVQARYNLACFRDFAYGVVRTSVFQPIVRHMYLDQLGYKILAIQDTVSTKIIDGMKQEAPDARVIMAGRFPKREQTYKEKCCEH